MFSRETLKYIWEHDLRLGYARPRAHTERSPLPHPADRHNQADLTDLMPDQGKEEPKTGSNSGPTFVLCYDPTAKKRRVWFESSEDQK